jgi:hypothetical protein
MKRLAIDGKVYRLAAVTEIKEVEITTSSIDGPSSAVIVWVPEDRFGTKHPGYPIVEVGDA